jgi:hypothetical protein
MRRTEESGAYLGGIVAMLEVADVCPRCGQSHGQARAPFRQRSPSDCPAVVLGSFPVLGKDAAPLTEVPPVPASQRIRQFEVPVPASASMIPGALASSRRDEETRVRRLAVPWLPPPDLGEVF